MSKFLLLTVTLMILMSNFGIAESDTVWVKKIGSEVLQVKFSPDGEQIYVGAANFKPFVVSTVTGETIKEFEQSFVSVTAMDLSKDGQYLAVGGGQGKRVQLIETISGSVFRDFIVPDEIVNQLNVIIIYSVSISKDFHYVTIAVRGTEKKDPGKNLGFVVTWDITANQLKDFFHDSFIQRVQYSPTENLLVTCHSDESNNNIILINTETWKPETTLCCHTSLIQDISFSPDGSLLASCDWDGFIKIWDIEQKKLIKDFSGNFEVNSVGFIGNDKVVGGCGTFQNRYVKIWDLTTEKFLGHIKTNIQLDLNISEIKHYCVVANGSSGLFLFDYLKIINGINESDSERKELIKPNPSNNFSEIEFFLPFSGKTFISINDANAKEIEILFNGFLEQGEHKFQWIPKGVSSGVYYCNISGNNFSKTLKIILER